MSMRRVFVATILLVLTVSWAHATILTATLSQYCSFAGGYGYGGSMTGSIGRFDPSLGTLRGVTITVTGYDALWCNTTNTNTLYGLDVTASLSGSWRVSGPAGVDWTFTHPAYSDTVSLGPNDGSGTNTHYFNMNRDSLAPVNGTGVTIVDPSNFAYFTGTGNLADYYQATNSVTDPVQGSVLGDSSAYISDWYTNNGPGLERSGQWTSGGMVTVQYTYLQAGTTDDPPADVPEPCTLALLGVGAIGMGLRARRRKIQAAG